MTKEEWMAAYDSHFGDGNEPCASCLDALKARVAELERELSEERERGIDEHDGCRSALQATVDAENELRVENAALRTKLEEARAGGVRLLHAKAHATWQANPGPSDWIAEFEEAYEACLADLVSAANARAKMASCGHSLHARGFGCTADGCPNDSRQFEDDDAEPPRLTTHDALQAFEAIRSATRTGEAAHGIATLAVQQILAHGGDGVPAPAASPAEPPKCDPSCGTVDDKPAHHAQG